MFLSVLALVFWVMEPICGVWYKVSNLCTILFLFYAILQMLIMIKKVNAADLIIVLVPGLSASNFSPIISITDSRISETIEMTIFMKYLKKHHFSENFQC
jgi:hypothetical protein